MDDTREYGIPLDRGGCNYCPFVYGVWCSLQETLYPMLPSIHVEEVATNKLPAPTTCPLRREPILVRASTPEEEKEEFDG